MASDTGFVIFFVDLYFLYFLRSEVYLRDCPYNPGENEKSLRVGHALLRCL